MSNPMLNEKFFRAEPPQGLSPMDQRPGGFPMPTVTSAGSQQTMTLGGTLSATALMLVVVLAGAAFGWSQVDPQSSEGLPVIWLFGCMIGGLVMALVCSFKPRMAQYLALPYSLAEGIFIGIISHMYDARTQGVALQAVLGTIAVFCTMLVLYGSRAIRVTPRLTKGIIAATVGVLGMYVMGWIISLFSDSLSFMQSTSGLGILISVVVVGVAAFNLLIDFDFIERGTKAGLPSHMNWFAAFGLIATLVWLYLEMLRLLSKLQRR